MKKLFKLSFAAMMLALVAFSTTSCDTTPPPPGPDDPTIPNGAIVMNKAEAQFYGPADDNGSADMIIISLLSKEYVDSKEGEEEGEVLDILLLANTSATAKLTPGTYTVEELTGKITPEIAIAGMMTQQGPLGTFLYTYPLSSIDDLAAVTSGEIKITEASGKFTIQADVEIDGTKKVYYYSGEVQVEDKSPKEEDNYTVEDKTVTTQEYTYAVAEAINYGGSESDAIYVNLVTSTKGIKTVLLLYAPTGTTSLNGTFPINKTESVNTAQASQGYINNSLYPCLMGKINDKGQFTEAWFLVSGSITINTEGLTFEAKSYFGSTIKGTYNGAVIVREAEAKASAPMLSPMQSPKLSPKSKLMNL